MNVPAISPHRFLPGKVGELSEDGYAPWRHGDGFLLLALNFRLGTRVFKYGGHSLNAYSPSKGVSEQISLVDLGCPKRLPGAAPLSIRPLSNYPPDSYHQKLLLLIHEFHVNGPPTGHIFIHFSLNSVPKGSQPCFGMWQRTCQLFSGIASCHRVITHPSILPFSLGDLCIRVPVVWWTYASISLGNSEGRICLVTEQSHV